jgi:hypothetical protein
MRYLGSISGASGGYNNVTTGASGLSAFAVPPPPGGLFYLEPGASGLRFEMFGATGATNTTAARAAALAGPGVLNGPFRAPPGPGTVVALYNQAGGFFSCRVFWTPSS